MSCKLRFIEERPFNGKDAKRLVIFLHGYGSDMYDLFDLKNSFVDNLPDAHFISVNAPYECDTGNGYQWFSLKSMDIDYIYAEIRKNYKIVNKFIDEQVKRFDIGYKDVVLIGFSQGTMMSLFASLRNENKLLAVIGFSGVLTDKLENLKAEIKTKQNILLIHGTDDKIIPYEYFYFTEKLLRAVDVKFITETSIGLDHSIDLYGIQKARDYIKNLISI